MTSLRNPNDAIGVTPKHMPSAVEMDGDRTVQRRHLVNILNYINFIEETILAVFCQKAGHLTAEIPVRPMPCAGSELFCRWTGATPVADHPDSYHLDHLRIADDGHDVIVTPEWLDCTAEGILLGLPETCFRMAGAESVVCQNRGLTAAVFQNGVPFKGRLLSFTANSLNIAIDFSSTQTNHWICSQSPVYVVLSDDAETYYSSECRIESERRAGDTSRLALQTVVGVVGRFRPKAYRSQRVLLQPVPEAVFCHPLSLKKVVLKVENLSGSGFSALTDSGDAELLTGLIIPNLRLEFAGETLVHCKAQVVHNSCPTSQPGPHRMRYGMAILDIDIIDHFRLQKLVQRAGNPHASMNGRLDLNALWRFFFKSGFIYPEKYAAWESRKQHMRKIYDTLYLGQPNFARHFIYQRNGDILGHGAMLRIYGRAWMIHHHAALISHSILAGLSILDQMGHFINESHKLAAMKMDYVFSFYRPNNKFPKRLLGDAVRFSGDAAKSSVDEFAYGHFCRRGNAFVGLPPGWRLESATDGDVKALQAFYDHHAGGLMMDAFDLRSGGHDLDELSRAYAEIGFRRQRRLFALKTGHRLAAFFEVNLSDMGLNMSDLTNCVRLFLLDPAAVNRDILCTALSQIEDLYEGAPVPVMVFPASHAVDLPFDVERHYLLWIMNLQYTDLFFAYMRRIARFSRSKR